MSEKPKRKFWQFHLSTVVLLTLTAGGLSWPICVSRVTSGSYEQGKSYVIWKGWPFHYYEIHQMFNHVMPKQSSSYELFIGYNPLLCDIAIGLVLLGLMAAALESFIRRREARKT